MDGDDRPPLPRRTVSYSFSIGACRSDNRLIPTEPKSTSALAASPLPWVAMTVPIPNEVCSTRSPTSTEATVFIAGRDPNDGDAAICRAEVTGRR